MGTAATTGVIADGSISTAKLAASAVTGDKASNEILRTEEKSANFTAVAGRVYIVTATCTVTDPTPAQGMAYEVIVRNGTATVGGTGYGTAGNRIVRIYHSGAWASYRYAAS